MSTRIRTDGRRYNPETDLPIRPYHKPEPPSGETGPLRTPWWRCVICGSTWHWVDNPRTAARFRRHDPGTFWEQD